MVGQKRESKRTHYTVFSNSKLGSEGYFQTGVPHSLKGSAGWAVFTTRVIEALRRTCSFSPFQYPRSLFQYLSSFPPSKSIHYTFSSITTVRNFTEIYLSSQLTCKQVSGGHPKDKQMFNI